MSRNQQSSWHHTPQKDILFLTPAHLELVPEGATDLELCTTETLRRTQEELQWYRNLYENTPSVYLTLDATGKILSVNKFGADSLGYTPEQLIQTSIFNLFEQSDKQRLSDAFRELLTPSPKSEITNWEFRLNVRKIAWVKIAARILPLEEANALILMICEDITAQKQTENLLGESELGSCIDITERKLREVALLETQEATQAQFDEIESLNRLKDEFINTISHELRTPLTNMKMAIQMLGISLEKEQNFLSQMNKPQTERSKAARYFQILDNECDREINLINNFLDLQKLNTNTKPLVLETIQVQQWLCRVLQVFQARNRNSSQQQLQLNIAANLPPLICDPFSLERILMELLTNACKFSPPEAQITLSAQLKSKGIQFQVINTGVEIPTTEIPLIFNKFYRIPSNDPWKQGGAGLGLTLVQKLTLSLGGTIEVESQSNRTCFTILLPKDL
ncbi:PAS domain-containing sensor histidine kinase [Scytonema hofmannii FACHB-248]|uniref:histidine kinase n=1 Tax=Scytonema hofmannii FACHB-248 TaxID=1842502 RepID=A0ABR8H017_9CYAN|nr:MULTISPECIES: PAS domain-containing sensor histidine kinase [Nostocales]MBD2609165.1 PAS domain-containing sensor histidine kinase [Scytonema hofmannii FACHB-248]